MASRLTNWVNSDPISPGETVLTVGSLITVGLGVWLPWLIIKPGHTGPVPQIYLSGMETGIAGQDYLILGVAMIGLSTALTLSTYYRRKRLGRLVRGITGLVIALVTLLWVAGTTELNALWWFIGTNDPETGILEAYVLSAGVYLTLLGGILLLIAGASELTHGHGQNTGPSEH